MQKYKGSTRDIRYKYPHNYNRKKRKITFHFRMLQLRTTDGQKSKVLYTLNMIIKHKFLDINLRKYI